MPVFPTPEPITVVLGVTSGQVRIVAGDRADTAVQINPGNEASASDVKAAEQTQVDFSGGRLTVTAPEPSGLKSAIGTENSVDVTIELPAGSSLEVTTAKAEIRTEGLLGECRVHTASAPVRFDRTGALRADSADGPLTVGRVSGHAAVSVASGRVRIGEIDGTGAIDGVNGDIWIGQAAQDLEIGTADGDIAVDRAAGNVTAQSSGGSIRIGEVARGRAELMTAEGQLDVGIREGTAAWIDARSRTGSVRNSLAAQEGPEQFAEKVKVRARTRSGDVVIRRAPQHGPSAHE
ncbi:DUF4097 family beta strand repeat-containing protein [Streptomyces sp. NPDC018045]|uniref:DUF4097 family beta strand repeat-containing protein n=1 Tax=Streptomyces sp. NPDC018045 TaxID=3365037 RepID=UPI0037B6DABC